MVSVLLCALNRAPVLAALQGIAALIVCRVRFGQTLALHDLDALLSELRDARSAGTLRTPTRRATVTPNVIAVASSANRWTQVATAFRDEMVPDRWRQLTTALRHQPRPPHRTLSAWVSTKFSRTQFAKNDDL